MDEKQFGTSEKSIALTRYLRNAKANKTDVLCAIDMQWESGKQVKITSYLKHLALIKYGDKSLARLFMNGYIMCMLSQTTDMDELEEATLDDLYESVKELGPIILGDVNKVIDNKNKVDSEKETIRELTRRDANKPKE